jgi:hypothetical protein
MIRTAKISCKPTSIFIELPILNWEYNILLMSEILVYVGSVITTFLLVPYVIFIVLFKHHRKTLLNIPERLMLSCTVGPSLISTLLGYLLLLVPHQSSLFYFLGVLTPFLAIFFIYRLYFNTATRELWHWTRSKFTLPYLLAGIVLLTAWQYVVFTVPVLRHDTFEYATWGNTIFRNKAVLYTHNTCDQNTGFYYVAKHGLSFPLFAVWGNIYNDMYKVSTDYFFRSITGWYWILIVCLFYYWIRSYNKTLAAVAVLCLITAPAFAASFVYYHVDTYRILLLMLSLYFFTRCVERRTTLYLVIFGVLCGLMSNAHSIGVFFTAIYYLLYVAFAKLSLRQRVNDLLLIAALTLIFGGIHYILDILFGTGWILIPRNI